MPHEFTEGDVRAYWEECGPIETMDLLKFKDTGRFNGAAFITFQTEVLLAYIAMDVMFVEWCIKCQQLLSCAKWLNRACLKALA